METQVPDREIPVTTSTQGNQSTTSSSSMECPYAVALLQPSSSHSRHAAEETDGTSVQSADDASVEDLLTATRLNCPAFAKAKGCPFKHASSPNQVKETLLQIPPSHYEMSSFMQVLQGLHATSGTLAAPEKDHYQLPGGCPVPPSIKSSVPAGGFRHVLETMSLAAIMAQMAQELEDTDELEGSTDFVEASMITENVESNPPLVDTATASSPKPTTTSQIATPRLSQSLKTGTAVAHEAAENVHFVKNFIRGQIDRRLYGDMVVSLYHVYKALEDALDQHGPVEFPQCHFPTELSRTGALQDDVEFWQAPLPPPPSPATVDYVARIQYLANEEPLLLLAHSYTRYLGDLSGGKILERVARRALYLDRPAQGGPTQGLAFYHFAQIPSAKRFKDDYRQALDDLPLSAIQIQRLVQEANVAFLLNMRLFEELDVAAHIPHASVRPLEDVLRIGPDHVDSTLPSDHHHNPDSATRSSADSSSENKCPFLVEKQAAAAARTGEPSTHHAVASTKEASRCPWPFVVFHDPRQFVRDWQTWALLGIFLCVLYSQWM